MSKLREWLLLIYKVPTEPARKRTYVWRKLKKMGAIYLQQAAAVLPNRPGIAKELEGLTQRILEFGGEVTLLKTQSVSTEWEQDVMRRFNQQRDEEYTEVVEQAQRIIDELERESERGKFNFAELEENEEALDSLKRWMAQVKGRDFFGAAGLQATEGAVKQASGRLQEFARKVYEQEEQ